jgi:mannose-6-phosphate isomerase
VHTLSVQAGESIFIPSGRIHAIGGGNLILEIQQNSDTTYRVYDWGRVGLDGQPRELHIDQSLRSTDFDDFEPSTLKTSAEMAEQLLADSPVFRMRKLNLKAGECIQFAAGEPKIISLLRGRLNAQDGSSLVKGDNALLPAAAEFDFACSEDCACLVTDHFNKL